MNQQPPLPMHWNGSHKLSGAWTILTLEEGTCCDRAVGYFVQAFETAPARVVVPSFEQGISRARHHRDAIVLLPHVHETCSTLTTSPEWKLLGEMAFPLENPPLVLAQRPGFHEDPTQPSPRCATIERLRPLLDGPAPAPTRFETVQTTQDAARLCAAPGGPELCITNQCGADRHGLTVVKRLKHMTIWWMPFRHVMT